MSYPDRYASAGGSSRTVVIATSVLLLHVGALWALQSGLLRRAAEVIVPAEVLAQFIAPPAPEAPAPPPPAPPPPAAPPPRKTAPPKAPLPLTPVARPDPAPSPNAPVAMAEAAPAPEAPPAPAAPPAPPAPPTIELPSSNAAYLNNPKPAYPSMSRRMGEQGKVVLRVLIDAQGLPQQVELKQSSGYERLDQQALETVQRWRFVPGKRNGVPEAMWNVVPIQFVLE